MSSPKHKSASSRYLKARLRLLTRPEFWAGNLILCIVLLFAWEYFINPNWLQGNIESKQTDKQQVADSNTNDKAEPKSKMPDEESAAIAADIDSSSVLEQELNIGVVPNSNSLAAEANNLPTKESRESSNRSQQSSKGNSTQTAQLQLIPTSPNTQQQNYSNPFAASAQQLLSAGSISNPDTDGRAQQMSSDTSSLNLPISTLGSNRFNSSIPNSGSDQQTSLNQAQQVSEGQTTGSSLTAQTLAPTNSPTGFTRPINIPANSIPVPTGYPYPQQQTTLTPQNSYTYLTQPQAQPIAPTAVPAAQPLTPVPGAPINAVPYSSQLSNQPINNNLGANSAVGNSVVQPSQLNQSSFSVPRPVPGRYIGNGEINTFSNP